MNQLIDIIDYPQTIADLACALAEVDRDIASLKLQIERCKFEAESKAAFDLELRNEGQRKVKTQQILQGNLTYLELVNDLQSTTHQRDLIVVRLERYRNEFAVAKLQTQMQVADKWLLINPAPELPRAQLSF